MTTGQSSILEVVDQAAALRAQADEVEDTLARELAACIPEQLHAFVRENGWVPDDPNWWKLPGLLREIVRYARNGYGFGYVVADRELHTGNFETWEELRDAIDVLAEAWSPWLNIAFQHSSQEEGNNDRESRITFYLADFDYDAQ